MGRRIPGRSVLCSTNKTAKFPRLSVTRGPPRHSIAPTGGSAGVAPAKRRALSQPAHSNGTPIRLRLCVSLPAGYHRAPQHTLSPQGAGITARLSKQPRNPSFARPRTGVATGAEAMVPSFQRVGSIPCSGGHFPDLLGLESPDTRPEVRRDSMAWKSRCHRGRTHVASF